MAQRIQNLAAVFFLLIAVSYPGPSLGGRQLLQNFSECPADPLERCDFYLDGYHDEIPVISLNELAAIPVSPSLREAAFRQLVEVQKSGQTEFLCPHVGVQTEQFYFGKLEPGKLTYYPFQSNKTLYENSCFSIFLEELTVFQTPVTKLKLKLGDENQVLYPDARRCLIFTTSPKGYEPGKMCFL